MIDRERERGRTVESVTDSVSGYVCLLVSLQISFLLASLCLCFKRRDEDVLPPIDFASKVKVYAEG